jgi:serine-type anaerobic sulfatase-maturating enzyme
LNKPKMVNLPPVPTTSPHTPLAFHLLAKPTGAACNLDCRYCFFLSKEMLYPGSHFRMTDELLEVYIRQLLEAQSGPEVSINWQGGEPTLMGLDFFQHSVAYVEKYKSPEQQVLYTIQTNGTKIDHEWASFFKQHDFLVGLSVDGPKEFHDVYRVNKGGQGTFDQVMKGWQLLMEYGVDVNILCTVNAANADRPIQVYHFFRDELNAQYMQFIPIVERVTAETLDLANQGWSERPGGDRPLYTQIGDLVTERSVKPEQYGQFLVTIFDEWVRRDIGKVFVQSFDVALASWVGQPSLCIFQPTCGESLALEHNGDLYACDHFVEPDFLLGNIQNTHMIDLVSSEQQHKFGQEKNDTLPQYCRDCEVLFACYGECPRNRFIHTPDGEMGLNYLCAGYKQFFKHIDRPMRMMAGLLRRGRYADEVMDILAQEELQKIQLLFAQAQPDDLCPCGSGKIFRKCHGRKLTKN